MATTRGVVRSSIPPKTSVSALRFAASQRGSALQKWQLSRDAMNVGRVRVSAAFFAKASVNLFSSTTDMAYSLT